jgi:tetratricopeptide (TPR) repeat protein
VGPRKEQLFSWKDPQPKGEGITLFAWLLAACTPEVSAPAVPVDGPAAAGAEATPALTATGRTPLLLVTLDTTRADRIGAWGHEAAATPNLDALAARGARFERAYTPTPLTIPAHASLHTGLYPPRHGVRDNGDFRLSPEAMTLAERLTDAGYTCHAAVAAFVTQAPWGFDQGFAAYKDALGVPADRLSWRAERPADAVIDDALESLTAGADCLWVHLFDAHAPYAPPAPYNATHPDPYDGEIAWMDSQLGRLLEAAPEGALVVVAGDHGEAFGEGGEARHGMLLTEGALHVPLIVAGPGVAAGQVVERPVSLVDVLPTALRLLDLPAAQGIDGVDLFSEAPAAGVYSETRYGYYHFGWAPLTAVTTADGRLVRGARDVGTVPPEAEALMVTLADASPAWAPAPATLDLAELEQLVALGYVGAPAPPAAAETLGPDPRDAIGALETLQAASALPPGEREAALRALLEEQPEMREARAQLGLLLARLGRLEEGLSQLVDAYRARPDATLAVSIGRLYLQAAAPEEALRWFEEALARDPGAVSARAGAVAALLRAGESDEAAARAELLLAEVGEHAEVLLIRAELAMAGREPLEPWLAPLERLAGERPWQPGALQTAGRLLWMSGDQERGEALLLEALRWRPADTSARLDLMTLYREQGRLVNYIKTLRPLLNLQPDEPRWQAMAAAAYLEMARPDLAAPHQEACAGHPHCPN